MGRGYRRLRRFLKRGSVKALLVIVLVCLVAAALIHYLMREGDSRSDPWKELAGLPLDQKTLKALKEGKLQDVDPLTREKIQKAYEGRGGDASELERVKQAYKDRINPETLERLKEEWKKRAEK